MPQKTRKRTNKNTLSKRRRMRYNKSYSRRSNKEKLGPRITIKNSGSMSTITKVNNQTSQRNIDWTAKYNGKDAVVHANLDVDGKKAEIDKHFDKNEINQLLGIPVENEPLENRLQLLSAPNDARMEQLFSVNRPMNTRQFTIRI